MGHSDYILRQSKDTIQFNTEKWFSNDASTIKVQVLAIYSIILKSAPFDNE